MTSDDDNKAGEHGGKARLIRSPGSAASSPTSDKLALASSAIRGPISVVPGGVPSQQRPWAKSFLQMLSTSYQPQGEGPSPPLPITDADIAAVDAAPITTILDDGLKGPLAEIGYRRVAKFTYLADWNTPEVQHLLRFSTQYIPPTFLVGDAAVRNPNADAFIDRCRKYTILKRYEFKDVRTKWDWPSVISLSFLGAWGGDRSVQIAEVDPKVAIARIVDGVRDKVIPYFSKVRTMADLYDFLVRGEEPMNWRRCGGPSRMAQIAYLGRALDYSPADIADMLMPHVDTLKRIVDPEEMPWDRYVHTIIADAGVFLNKHESK